MILSCTEVHFDHPDALLRQWIVCVTGTETPDSILLTCGKIPKAGKRIGDLGCVRIECEPTGPYEWKVSAHFEPVVTVAEEDDEPKFPPYSGPKGSQPDGSFILTPKCVHFMEELFLRGGSQFPLNDHVHNFSHAIYEETGTSFMEWT